MGLSSFLCIGGAGAKAKKSKKKPAAKAISAPITDPPVDLTDKSPPSPTMEATAIYDTYTGDDDSTQQDSFHDGFCNDENCTNYRHYGSNYRHYDSNGCNHGGYGFLFQGYSHGDRDHLFGSDDSSMHSRRYIKFDSYRHYDEC
uniref:Uncharacterized protein n=1 Tax=Leersia perrieri TaxID=77586 RepID=A0A0D9XCF1_9ORYZ